MLIQAGMALLPEGWVRDVTVELRDGRIHRVGPATGGDRVEVLLPAPVNLHSHVFQRAMAGLTEFRSAGQDSFWTWRSLMYRFLDRLTPQDVEAIAAQVMVESAEAGFAGLAEFHYLHHAPGGEAYDDPAEMAGRICQAARDTGLGLTLLPVMYQRGGCDGRALAGGQLRFGCDTDRFARLWALAAKHVAELAPDARIGIAPHSLRAVDKAGLTAALDIAPEGPVHIHVAEQLAEVVEVQAHMGARPVECLMHQMPVDQRWCLIHATQMTPQEVLDMAASGAVAGLCPITEANLGDGVFDAQRYLGAGGSFGVGSDSNVLVSLREELRTLEYSQRLARRGRAILATEDRSTGRVLWEGVAKGGARAAGRASGQIAEGMWADLVALSLDDVPGRSGDAVLDTFVFTNSTRIDRLWSAGRQIVQDGRHIARDPIAARFRAVMARLGAAL